MVEPKTQPGPETFPVVRFDEREQQIIKHIAAIRDRTYDPIDGGQTHGNQSRYDAHRTGVMGEAAVTKFLDGLNFHDMNVMFPFGDEGHDLVIRGKTVDVKATKTNLSIPDLIVPESPRPSADWFILVHVLGDDSARLIGMAQLDVVLDHEIRQAPGERRNYWIPPEDLVLFTR